MKYFKIVSLTFLIFCTFFIPKIIFAENSVNFTVGAGGCYVDGIVTLDKTIYFEGEQIFPGYDQLSIFCNGYQGMTIVADGYCVYSDGFSQCGSNTDLFADELGTHSVNFEIQLDALTGPYSGSTSLSYTVVPPPLPTITANPGTILYGQTSEVSWNAPYATSCLIWGAGGGGGGTTGSLITPSLHFNTTYTINCGYNNGVVRNATTNITVNTPPVSVNISAQPNPITSGGTSNISWNSTGANSCMASNSQGGSGISGSFTTPNLYSNTTYSVTCSRPAETIPGQCGGSYWNIVGFLPCSGFGQSACQTTSGCYWHNGGTVSASSGSNSETVYIENNEFNVSLIKPDDKIKNFVKAGVATEEGTGYLNVNIYNLPVGKSCQLKKNGVNYAPPYLVNSVNLPVSPKIDQLTLENNVFQLVCNDNLNTMSIPQSFKAQSGVLTVPTSCTILAGRSYCNDVPVSWTTINPHNNPSYSSFVANNIGEILTSGTNNGNGTQNISIRPYNEPPIGGTSGTTTLKLMNRVDGPITGQYTQNTLETKTITLNCAPNTTWNGNICSIPNKPDLIASATTPVTAIVGTAQAFTTTITNQGNADTDYEGVNTFTNLFQTATGFEDPASQTEPIGVLSYAVAGMGVLNSNGGSSTASKSITFNSPGTYYVRACADKNSAVGLGVISESNENEYNNCGSWTPVLVTTVAQPDLIAGATSPTLAVLNIGQTYTTSIRNQGTGSTGRGFQNLFQTATGFDDPTSFLGPINLLTYTSPQSTPTLGINASSNTTSPPITFSAVGNYYMRVCADLPPYDYGYITNESNESNNCGPWSLVQVSASPTINLRASNPTPTTVTIGNPVNFTSIISNSGNTGTGNSFYNTFQIATEANGGGTLTRINSTPNPMPALGPGEFATATSVSYTFTGASTTRSVRACADINQSGNGQIAEIPAPNELDNCSSWVNITFPNLSGNLSASNCQIRSGESSCNTILNWNTINPINGGISAVTTPPNNTIVRTALSGTNFPYSISFGERDFYLYHSTSPTPTLLDQATATASCLSLADTWINGKCSPAGLTYVVTATAGSNGTISPASRNVSSGMTTTFTVTPNTGYVATITGTCPPGVLNGSIYTTGIITSNCNVRADFKADLGGMTGSLTGENCEIEEGDNSCTTTLSWAINKTEAVASEITASGMTPISLNTPTIGGNYFGNKTVTVPHSERTFYLYNNGVSLVPTSESPNGSGLKITANCKLGTNWDSATNRCVNSNLMTGSLTGENCEIEEGDNSCTTTLSWAINKTEAVASEITASGMTPISLNTPTIGGNYFGNKTVTVPHSERTFYLYNNGVSLVPTSESPNGSGLKITANCKLGTNWDILKNGCISNGLPVVRTSSPVTNITQNSAMGGGQIVDNGGSIITTSGLVWDMFGFPTLDDNIGSTNDGPSSGSWTSEISPLIHSSVYFVRAYAINNNGIGYGDPVEFTTLSNGGGGGGSGINITFTASPTRIFKGRSSTLSWNAQGATSCSGSTNTGEEFNTGGLPYNSLSVKPSSTTTYILGCKDDTGNTESAIAEVKVSVIKFFEF